MKLQREYKDNFWAPFVACSFMKIGMKFIEAISLPNGCVFIVGEIILAQVPDESVNDKGQIDLSNFNAVGVGGLNSYYRLKKIAIIPMSVITKYQILMHKSNLPTKLCLVCQRPFNWRKNGKGLE